MGDELMLMVLLEWRSKLERRRTLKKLRDDSNPFSISESIFRSIYRFPRSLCLQLISELEIFDGQKTRLPFHIRFLSVLFFYAHGSYQKCIGNCYLTALSQASMSRCLGYITELIITHKQSEIKFPQSDEEIMEIKSGFYREFGIKATIGTIDCTHVAIKAPPSNNESTPASLYMNTKGYYSINVEATCDHRLLFTSINARFPGSCHDSGIWTTSPVRIHLMSNYNAQKTEWLLGDSNQKEEKYNKLHAKSRNSIERGFGVLKSRFRCLLKHRTLHYNHEKAGNIVYACAILHNILTKNNIYLELENIIADSDVTPSGSATIVGDFREAQRIRNRYVESLL